MTRIAVVDDAARVAIRALCAYADEHRMGRARLAAMVELRESPVGDDPAHCLTISGVYRCVYSVEEHPAGWCRHLSVSIVDPNPARPLPSVGAVQTIAGEFGFRCDIRTPWCGGAVWVEAGRAVNVVEQLASSSARFCRPA